MENTSKPLVSDTTIEDLLDIIHRTIIKENGDNNISVKHIAAISKLIRDGKLKNYAINTPFYWGAVFHDVKKNYPEVQFQPQSKSSN
jgi:hypothetical protein